MSVGSKSSEAPLTEPAALGLALAALLAIAWLAGIVYSLVRLRLGSPVGLAIVDGVHLYSGLASIPLLAAKAWQVHRRPRPRSWRPSSRWHAWMATSLLPLYACVYVSGGLLLLPVPAELRDPIAEAHLTSAVWAAVPTTWHLVHYVRGWKPRAGLPTITVLAAVLLAPGFWFGLAPRSLTLQSNLGSGSTWRPAGLQGVYLTEFAVARGGDAVAAGDGLYVSEAGSTGWRKVGPPDIVLSLVLPDARHSAYLGTSRGLYVSDRVAGPFRRLSLPATDVRGIVVTDAAPAQLVVTTIRGVWMSVDGGSTWLEASTGLASPQTASAVSEFEGSIYASDSKAVYRWDGGAWDKVAALPRVVSLDVSMADGRLFASSLGGGVQFFDGKTWRVATLFGSGHRADPHVRSVTPLGGGRLVAASGDGALESIDGGVDWYPFGSRLDGEIGRIGATGQTLIAATDHGVFEYRVPPTSPPQAVWWAVALAAGAGAGAGAAGVVFALSRRRSRRWPGEAS